MARRRRRKPAAAAAQPPAGRRMFDVFDFATVSGTFLLALGVTRSPWIAGLFATIVVLAMF